MALKTKVQLDSNKNSRLEPKNFHQELTLIGWILGFILCGRIHEPIAQLPHWPLLPSKWPFLPSKWPFSPSKWSKMTLFAWQFCWNCQKWSFLPLNFTKIDENWPFLIWNFAKIAQNLENWWFEFELRQIEN